MPRAARIVIPNVPHHVTQRGGRSQQTFFEDHDYEFYLDLLSAAKTAAKASVWAYCLMPNHVHLIVVPDERDSLAMDEEHLLAAVRYVELNPVRAGLCDAPEQWRWSSARAHLAATCDEIVDVEPMLSRIPDWSDYLANFDGRESVDRIRKNMQAGRPVGSDRFIKRLEDIVKRRLRHRKRGPAPALPADEYPW